MHRSSLHSDSRYHLFLFCNLTQTVSVLLVTSGYANVFMTILSHESRVLYNTVWVRTINSWRNAEAVVWVILADWLCGWSATDCLLPLLHLSLFFIPYFRTVHLDCGVWNETEVLTAMKVCSVICGLWHDVNGYQCSVGTYLLNLLPFQWTLKLKHFTLLSLTVNIPFFFPSSVHNCHGIAFKHENNFLESVSSVCVVSVVLDWGDFHRL